MVGPSITSSERRAFNRKLGIGFVVMTALSGALTAVFAEAPLVVVAGMAAGGAVVGALLWWYLRRIVGSIGPGTG